MKYNILLIESSEENLNILKEILFSINPRQACSIISTHDWENAYKLSTENSIDLIIIDFTSPAINGLDIVKNFKQYEPTRNIPIIILSDSDTSDKLHEAINLGISDFVRKPIEKYELISRIKSSLLIKTLDRLVENQRKIIFEQSKQLEKSSLLASIIDNSVMILSANGRIEWVNNGFFKLHEYSFNELNDKYEQVIYKDDFYKEILKGVKECFEKNKIVSYQNRYENSVGRIKWIQTTLTPVIKKNKIEKFLAVETDITSFIEIVQELEEKNEDLQTLTEHLKGANEILEQQKHEIEDKKRQIEAEKKRSDEILLNILPYTTAEELKTKGYARPRHYDKVTVLFTDFQMFTKSCEGLTPIELVNELDVYFSEFDDIIQKYNVEKIKTMGDAYMCAGGVPIRNNSNPVDVCLAGWHIQNFMNELKRFKKIAKLPIWELRLGIHTGEVIAGVVGKRKYVYDIWGDTVNIASRMEKGGEAGKVNISSDTYKYIKNFFDCIYRGKIEAKNKGMIDMYFIDRIKPELSDDAKGIKPNKKFFELVSRYVI